MNYIIKIGIYKITNTANGKFYIGSSVNIERRWNEHKRELKNNRHHSILLQRAFLKYGEDSFSFEIIENTDEKNLLKREQYYLDKLKPYEKNIGYNISPKAQNNVMRGEKHPLYKKGHTEETKKKMRNRKVTTETKKKMSVNHANVNGEKNPMYGKKHTADAKKKMSVKNKGKFTGEKSPRAKLTWEIVNQIRELYATGNYTQHQLEDMLKVKRSTISDILLHKRWI